MKRRNVIVAAVVAVAVLVAWVMVVWQPQSKSLKNSQAKAAAAEKNEASLRTELARLKGLQAHSAADQATLGKLNAALPSDANLADLLREIHGAAVAAGVDETTIAPTPPAAVAPAGSSASAASSSSSASGSSASASSGASANQALASAAAAAHLEQVKMTLSVKGSASQLMDFINRVNALPRLIVVDAVSMSGGVIGQTSSSGTFTGSITAHAFVRPDTGAAGAASGAASGTGA